MLVLKNIFISEQLFDKQLLYLVNIHETRQVISKSHAEHWSPKCLGWQYTIIFILSYNSMRLKKNYPAEVATCIMMIDDYLTISWTNL